MNTASSKSLDAGAWRKLYTEVLFEVDKTKLPERIAQAQTVLALRSRELFYRAENSTEERQALDHAVWALHALLNASQANYCVPLVARTYLNRH